VTREELVEQVKFFCTEHAYSFVHCIRIGKCYLVLINGDDCIQAFSQFLSELQGTKEYSTPNKIVDYIGSYITFY
jgi:hypothetical protein